jgi:glycosyltransferase involved in cell wall biosynthesis
MTRVKRKLKSLFKFVKKENENLYIFSPFFVPIQGNIFFDIINNGLFKIQLGLVKLFLKMKKPILWIENVRAADFLNSFNWQMVIYHVSDNFQHCPYTHNKQKLVEREQTISKRSDLTICVSKELYELKKRDSNNVHYLPHGVDFSYFRKAVENNEKFESISDLRNPVIGYFGTLTAMNDIELLEYCTENLSQYSFVIAGSVTSGDYTKLKQMPNVQMIGKVPYSQIASLCNSFSLCLLPWKMNEWIKSCNPLKFFEYMASGKPIVSVPIREVAQNYNDIVSVCGSKEEFCRSIEWELFNDNKERRDKRIAAAKEHSWDNHNEKLTALISERLNS